MRVFEGTVPEEPEVYDVAVLVRFNSAWVRQYHVDVIQYFGNYEGWSSYHPSIPSSKEFKDLYKALKYKHKVLYKLRLKADSELAIEKLDTLTTDIC